MMDRGVVRPALLAPFLFSLLIASAAVMPREASANCNNPQCTPSVDGSGCCKPDCTWRALNAPCRDEVNACHAGTCVDAGGGARTCQETVPTNNAANGVKCVVPESVCNIGECHSGNCGGIGSAGSGEFIPRCPDTDNNPCTQHCSAPENVFVECTTFAASDGAPCYADVGTNCTKGVCDAGECDTTGGQVQNCGTPPTCKRNTCDPTIGCSTEPTPGVSCDTNATDCIDSRCTDLGNCKNLAQPAGTPCSPGDGSPCTFDECNPSKDCNVTVPVPNDPITDCTNPSTGSCQKDHCEDGECRIFADATKNGQECTTDSNICSNQACLNGTCTTSSCNTGLACTLCGNSGYCTSSCACQF